MEEKENSQELIELEEDFIVIAVPADTVEIEIKSKFYSQGKLQEVARTMDFPEVRAMFKEAQDGYIPSNAIFSLVDPGKSKALRLVEEYLGEHEVE